MGEQLKWTAQQYLDHAAGKKPVSQPPARPLFSPEVYREAGRECVIAIEPMGAPRMLRSDSYKKREVVERYHAQKDQIRSNCATFQYQLSGLLIIRFELSMPASWSEKKRALHRGRPHQQKPDLDNMIKGFMDAFNADDSHVHTIQASKVWATQGAIVLTRT